MTGGALVSTDAGEQGRGEGEGPWAIAVRRLRRSRTAMASATLLVLIVVLSVAAPLYASYVAHTDAFSSNVSGTTVVNGQRVDVVQQSRGAGLGETPIGPTWDFGHYFFGADNQGRDVAARLLYGGRNSLLISVISALSCCLIASLLALFSGYTGGVIDALISRLMDIVWAFPVFLLAILIATVSFTQGIHIGPFTVSTAGILLPAVIITLIYVPYVFRPLRGEVLALREREFVQAAVIQGASRRWIVFSEVLPNLLGRIIVFLPLMIAINLLTESGLSFLGIGVQPPDASWGTIIADGEALIYSRPWVAIAPGLMITLTVVALNLFGDALREALDARSGVAG